MTAAQRARVPGVTVRLRAGVVVASEPTPYGNIWRVVAWGRARPTRRGTFKHLRDARIYAGQAGQEAE